MKKKLSVVIVTALFIFSVVGNVFAWTSFQNSNYLNNGLIDDGLTYPTAAPSVTVYTDLTRAGWSGIECGQCYCISYVHGANAASLAWNTNVTQGTSGATYTLQGVAAGGGYLVFGNDYANLIIMH